MPEAWRRKIPVKDKSIEELVKDAAKIQEGGMDPVVGDRQGECFLDSS